jgi:hypothetical protein
MGSLFTIGGRIKDVTEHDFIGFVISFISLFTFYHFEHIYLIRGKVGHIKFGHEHSIVFGLTGCSCTLCSLTQTK